MHKCSEEWAEPAQVPASPLTRTETVIDIMHTYMHQERSRARSVVQFQPLASNSASTQEAYTWKKQNYLRNATQTLQALAIHSNKSETAITSEKIPQGSALVSETLILPTPLQKKKKQGLSLGLVEYIWHLALAVAHLTPAQRLTNTVAASAPLEQVEPILT